MSGTSNKPKKYSVRDKVTNQAPSKQNFNLASSILMVPAAIYSWTIGPVVNWVSGCEKKELSVLEKSKSGISNDPKEK